LVNYGLRMDYLAGRMHPAKGIREDLIDANPGHDWDPSPYSTFKYPRNLKDIEKAMHYDFQPEVTPQAFLEEQGFQQKLQEYTGQPNYNKGLGGEGTLANETATGIVSLIEEGTARSSMRSLNIEYTGLQDEAKLFLAWGEKYQDQYSDIRRPVGSDGFPWTQVDHKAISTSYGIELKGTRGLVHKNLLAQRMTSILPMIIGVLNNPAPGTIEVLDQTLKQMDVDLNLKQILAQAGIQAAAVADVAGPAGPAGAGPGPGAGAPTLQNQAQGVAGAIPQARAQTGV
jgi:hypothetical protein